MNKNPVSITPAKSILKAVKKTGDVYSKAILPREKHDDQRKNKKQTNKIFIKLKIHKKKRNYNKIYKGNQSFKNLYITC